jgi:hypothetical protein
MGPIYHPANTPRVAHQNPRIVHLSGKPSVRLWRHSIPHIRRDHLDRVPLLAIVLGLAERERAHHVEERGRLDVP